MRIELKELKLQNFKGASKQTVTFGNPTEIRGANATGKTRLFDAFTWCLFGKDSEDKKDFSIKSLDANNEPLHRKDHTVTATLLVDGMELTLERTLREKWVTKRGEEEEEFQGHETSYKVNGIPHKQNEYQQKIDSIIREDLFKLLTNPFYFNTTLKWTERREMLSRMRNIQDTDVMEAIPELKAFFESLNGTPLDLFKRELAEKIKLLKKSLSDIPARIDENERKLQPDPDYAKIEKDAAEIRGQIQEVEKQLLDASERYRAMNQENQDRQNRIYELQTKIQETRNAAKLQALESYNEQKNQRDELRAKIFNAESRIVFKQESIKNRQAAIHELEQTNNRLREEWVKKNEEIIDQFDENQFVCPTCKRAYDTEDIEAMKAEMTANFNKNKAARLKEITNTGMENKKSIEYLRNEITQLEQEVSAARKEKDEAEQALPKFDNLPPEPTVKRIPQVTEWEKEIEELRSAIKPLQAIDTRELKEKKEFYQKDLDRLNGLARIKQTNQEILNRIADLEAEKRKLSQEIASQEKLEYKCQQFAYTKAKMIEEAVNSQFTTVRFKMFNRLINGGLEETCEALINGVPFQSANNAARINAGIDIINAFSQHFDIYAPIFCDNAEAVNDILETESQMIRLYVSRDKELKIMTKDAKPIRHETPVRRKRTEPASMA